jgi:leucyl aminopeptidase
MGPAELEAAARSLANTFDAACEVVEGDALLEEGFPAIHAVGRASHRPPRLIDLRWGMADAPRVTLVGKGVCFDTGGLDIKPAAAMRLMKKDMGGAAHALGLARMIMGAGLPVALRVLIPAVENSISGNAYRPGDVVPTRKGLTVEIGNTDAEGRMVLCDALALADEESPELLIDLATLTGAARVALGPELPAMYCDDEALAARLQTLGTEQQDPVWRMPLWSPYDEGLKSSVADLNHIATGSFAGSIYGALFLRRFVAAAGAWVHLDVFSWNPAGRPGRAEGGESQSIRALFALIEERYGRA